MLYKRSPQLTASRARRIAPDAMQQPGAWRGVYTGYVRSGQPGPDSGQGARPATAGRARSAKHAQVLGSVSHFRRSWHDVAVCPEPRERAPGPGVSCSIQRAPSMCGGGVISPRASGRRCARALWTRPSVRPITDCNGIVPSADAPAALFVAPHMVPVGPFLNCDDRPTLQGAARRAPLVQARRSRRAQPQ